MKLSTILLPIAVSCMASTTVSSQVTIGMGEAPAKLALLQLKDQAADASNVTGTKGGLVLPRVKLVDLNTLQPFMNSAETNYVNEKILSVGMMVYNVNDLPASSISPGVYCWNGQKWEMSTMPSAFSTPYTGSGAVKINVNQSKFITLSGTQSYGLLMTNQSATINPQYATGVYPGGTATGSPTSVITGTPSTVNGNDRALLMEAPYSGKANFYRMNMQFVMGNTPPAATRYFDVSVVSVGSGALVYQNSVVVPGGLNTGHVAYFQIFFPSIADAASIGVGYRIIFSVDTAASAGLSGQIGVKIVDVSRINQ